MSLFSEEDKDISSSTKKNTKIAIYLAAKHKNNPQFYTQLQEAAKNQSVVSLINRMMKSCIDPRQIINLKKLFLKHDQQKTGVMNESDFRKLYLSSVTKPDEAIAQDFMEAVKVSVLSRRTKRGRWSSSGYCI